MKWLHKLKYKLIISSILVVTGVSLISYHSFSFRLTRNMNHFMRENYSNIMEMLKNQSLYTISHYGGQVMPPLLKNLEKSPSIEQILLFSEKGKILYPKQAQLKLEPKKLAIDSVELQRAKVDNKEVIQAVMRIPNWRQCNECHDPTQKTLGYLVIDFSTHEIDENLALNKRHSIMYTVITVVLFLILMWFIHYFYIHFPLQKLIRFSQKVQLGDQSATCSIKSPEEFHVLAQCFQSMLDRLNRQQAEINRLHQIEIHQSRKLAEIGKMAATFAHEIKNPLMGIVNSVEIIARNKGRDIDSDIIEELHYQGKRITRAINELLAYTKPAKYNPTLNNINNLIQSVVKSIRSVEMRNSKIEFRLDLDPKIKASYFDYHQMEIAVSNLIFNAIQAIKSRGKIDVKTKIDSGENHLKIMVKDNGEGIPEDIQGKIFEPFFTTKQQGTGLGLALVRSSVEIHKGTIRVESDPNCGSCFTISIPYITEQEKKEVYA